MAELNGSRGQHRWLNEEGGSAPTVGTHSRRRRRCTGRGSGGTTAVGLQRGGVICKGGGVGGATKGDGGGLGLRLARSRGAGERRLGAEALARWWRGLGDGVLEVGGCRGFR